MAADVSHVSALKLVKLVAAGDKRRRLNTRLSQHAKDRAANGRRDSTLNWLPSNVLVSANERRLYPADIYPLSRESRLRERRL